MPTYPDAEFHYNEATDEVSFNRVDDPALSSYDIYKNDDPINNPGKGTLWEANVPQPSSGTRVTFTKHLNPGTYRLDRNGTGTGGEIPPSSTIINVT